MHGTGYDGYFISNDVKGNYVELKEKGVKIAIEYGVTTYGNEEFVFGTSVNASQYDTGVVANQ